MRSTTTARALAVAAVLALVPFAAAAQTYTANLTPDAVLPDPGPSGASGFATVQISGTTVSYNLLFSGVADPTAAHIHMGAAGETGGVVVDLAPSFTAGFASGSVTADQATIDAIVADPSGYYVQLHSSAFSSGALRGQLETGGAAGGETVLYHPVIANLPGQAGTLFVTDVRVLNTGNAEATVTVDFYAETPGGITSPTGSVTVNLAPGEQGVYNDIVGNVFGASNVKGGVIITSDQPITAGARIYNDQTDAGNGTLGQYQPGLVLSHGWPAGDVIFLQNVAAGAGSGFRSNIGWFNPNDAPVEVTFEAHDTNGFLIGSVTATAGPFEMQQVNVGSLFGALADYGDHYISYETSGGENLFVYGSVVDNVNGDASYIAATP
jgi:hypothetical protein